MNGTIARLLAIAFVVIFFGSLIVLIVFRGGK